MLRGLWLATLILLNLVTVVPGAYALTDEEIERRFQLLEQENAALEDKLRQVESILKGQGIDPANPLVEQKITASERSNETTPPRIALLEESIQNESARVKVDGFLSAGFSKNSESGGLNHQPYGFGDAADFESDSVLGIQMLFKINEQAKVVTQLVANGWDGWDLDVGWAYLAYELNDQLEFRAGRMRVPFYLYSESLDVGYSYPWVRPPLSMYITELNNYDGFDVTYRSHWGESTNRLSAYLGGYSFEANTHAQDVEVRGRDTFGVNWTSYWRDWTFRLAYSHLRNKVKIETETNLVFDATTTEPCSYIPVCIGTEFIFNQELPETINFYSYSTSYDDGTWLMIVEAAVTDVSEANLLSDEVQGVFTLGYRWNKWLPYGGYGREYYKNALSGDNVFARSKNKDYKLGFIGFRYDITPGVAAKLEWNYFYDFKGTAGPFDEADAFVNGETFDSVNIYTFLIDAVF